MKLFENLGLNGYLIDFSFFVYHFSNKKFAKMRLRINIDSVCFQRQTGGCVYRLASLAKRNMTISIVY